RQKPNERRTSDQRSSHFPSVGPDRIENVASKRSGSVAELYFVPQRRLTTLGQPPQQWMLRREQIGNRRRTAPSAHLEFAADLLSEKQRNPIEYKDIAKCVAQLPSQSIGVQNPRK